MINSKAYGQKTVAVVRTDTDFQERQFLCKKKKVDTFLVGASPPPLP